MTVLLGAGGHMDVTTLEHISKRERYEHQRHGNERICALAETWEFDGKGMPFSSVSTGIKVDKAPLIKGDHVTALPYWSRVIELENPKWVVNAEYHNGGSGVCEYSNRFYETFDGRAFSQVTERDLLLRNFSAEDERFVRNMSDLKAKASLRRALVNTPILVKERLQTISMASERVGDMMRVVKSVQDRDLKRFRRLKSAKSRRAFAQKAASSHLELIFGWLPLIDEVEGMMDYAMEESRTFVLGRGRHTVMNKTEVKELVQQPINWAQVNTGASTRQSFSCRTTLRAEITSNFGRNAQQLGFNPLYTLYDFTPLSFITGWFSNFNYVIQSLDPLLGAEFVTGSRSERVATVVRKSCVATKNHKLGGSKYHFADGYGVSHGSHTFTRRVVIDEVPDTHFEFYNNLSAYSVFAGISLYLQRRLKPIQVGLKTKRFRYKSKKPVYLPPIRYKRVINGK